MGAFGEIYEASWKIIVKKEGRTKGRKEVSLVF
jgi:hypothetical protein